MRGREARVSEFLLHRIQILIFFIFFFWGGGGARVTDFFLQRIQGITMLKCTSYGPDKLNL